MALQQLSTEELLFRGNRRMAWIFTQQPWRILLATSLLTLILLHLPAWLLHLSSLVDHKNRQVGFFAKYNWSIVYPVLIPVLLCLGARLFHGMRNAVYELLNPDFPIIVEVAGSKKPANEYPQYLARRLARTARLTPLVAAVASLLITAIDTSDLWVGFFNGGNFPASRVEEWDSGFKLPGSHANKVLNFIFDVDAYAIQTLAVFLGIFFIIKSWQFLQIMADIIDEDRPPYSLQPCINDLHFFRLGLQPLSSVFNCFLGIAILYEGFCFYHRIELIDSVRESEPMTYLKALIADIRSSFGTDHPDISEKFGRLFEIPTGDFALRELGNPSAWLPLVFIVILVLVISLFPLWHLFRYLIRKKRELIAENRSAYRLAMSEGNYAVSDSIEKTFANLQKASVWPNGSTAGSAFLIAMIALLFGIICPPLIIWGLTAGLALKAIFWVLEKGSKSI